MTAKKRRVKDMNQKSTFNFIGKQWLSCVVIFMVSIALFVFPVQAVGQWTQYGKMGEGENELLGAFSNPYSVTIDSSGNIYVADFQNHRIQKLTVATGEWSEWKKEGGGSGSALGEFANPTGVAVDNSGNVYVADYYNHRIQKLDLASGIWSEYKKSDGGSGSGLGEFSYPRGVTTDGHGNLYVADSYNHRIQKLDADSGVWSEWKKSDGGSGSGLGEFNEPTGVAVDGTGNVYVADSKNNRIQKLDVASGVWSEWKKSDDGPGNGLGEFNQPTGIAIDSSGNSLYVADSKNHRIQKLDVASGVWSDWKNNSGQVGSGLEQFNSPKGVALDSSGNVYVADSGNHRIQKLTVATGIWSEYGYHGTVAGTDLGEFSYPVGMAIDHHNNLYVADFSNNRIQKLDVASGVWSEWKKDDGGAGSGLGEFDSPTDVAIDGSGNIYVADPYNYRIQKLEIASGTWSEWKKSGGGSGNGLGEFGYPGGVAVDNTGNVVYVADTNNNRIQKLDVASGVWSEWKKDGGGAGSGLGEFNGPSGVEVDHEGNLYVADTGNHRIQKLDIASGVWSEWKKNGGGAGSGLGEFNEPYNVAIDSNGNIYVADSNNERIQKLDVASGVWSEWKKNGGGAGSGLGEFNSPLGVVVDSNGIVYVSEFSNHRIQKLESKDAPLEVPSAPTGVTAVAGNSEATVTFTEPGSNGGSLITGYTVIANPSGIVATGTESPIRVTGLTNGITYTFTVIATNSIGSSPASAISNSVKPEAVPVDNNSGGTSSQGSASAQPTLPAISKSDKTLAIVFINGKSQSVGTVKEINVNSQMVTTVVIDEKKLEDKLSEEGKQAVVTVPVYNKSDVVIAELNGQIVNKMAEKKAILEIKTDLATFRLPANQIDTQAILKQVGQAVALQDIKVQIEIAKPKSSVQSPLNNSTGGTVTFVVPPLDFTVKALYKDTTIEVTQFKAYVEHTMAIPEGIDSSKITTGVVIEQDGTLRHVPTKVILLDGKYYAQISSLTNSSYSVIWNPLEFKDVEQHWAKKAVNNMGSRMVVNGVAEGIFKPDEHITRAEFASILVRGLGLKIKAGETTFSDVAQKNWYADAIGTAFSHNLISGFDDASFHPNDKITREQAMTILSRAMIVTGLEAKNLNMDKQVLDAFTDAGTISTWAKSAILDCLKTGLVSGRNSDELAPKAFITRAEVAVIVERLLQYSNLINN
jgi:DNA-binding beta-propeller fold protein YncE